MFAISCYNYCPLTSEPKTSFCLNSSVLINKRIMSNNTHAVLAPFLTINLITCVALERCETFSQVSYCLFTLPS